MQSVDGMVSRHLIWRYWVEVNNDILTAICEANMNITCKLKFLALTDCVDTGADGGLGLVFWDGLDNLPAGTHRVG